ncbi:hypothetical protein L1049_025120 [Liquidambar formosana]|uniref:Cytochrome P450 n=1 Tax=Liquidambar formosana TaxID=63359 RepID=A0AAP0S2J6_LIQFO
MAVLVSVVVSVLVSSWCLKLLHMIWWKPKMIEKQLKKQGIYGLPYRLFYGNSKEMKKLSKETGSKPLGLSHDILHLDPFLQKMVLTYNKIFVTWFGTTPRVTIMDPKLITEILTNKSGDFRKNEINSFTKLFVTGLANYDGDKWAKHRKIINPAFHVEKLKQMLPAFSTCSEEMIEEWEKLAGMTGSCELDVSLEFQKLTSDMISRAAFGSSFQEGRMIFLLQKKQGQLLLRSLYKMMNFPWLRDPEQWGEDALEFNPERFSEGVSKATKDPIAYFPFGWGPRICIGQNFAMLEVKLALSLILQHFSFELSPSYTHAPQTGITLQPQYAAQIILYKL